MSDTIPHRRALLAPTLAVLAVVSAIAVAAAVTHTQRPPEAKFLFGKERRLVPTFSQVPMFDPMVLRLDLHQPSYVYVVSFDFERGAVCYFPTDFLGTDHLKGERMNFFTPGRSELPGTWEGKPQSWYVTDTREVHSLCVLISEKVLPDLEEVLTLTRQVGNRAFASRSMGFYMPRAGRAKVVGKRRMPHPLLDIAMNQESSVMPGPLVEAKDYPGVFVKVLNIRPTTPRAGAKRPDNPLRKQLEAAAKGELPTPATPPKPDPRGVQQTGPSGDAKDAPTETPKGQPKDTSPETSKSDASKGDPPKAGTKK